MKKTYEIHSIAQDISYNIELSIAMIKLYMIVYLIIYYKLRLQIHTKGGFDLGDCKLRLCIHAWRRIKQRSNFLIRPPK